MAAGGFFASLAEAFSSFNGAEFPAEFSAPSTARALQMKMMNSSNL
jgi:hypothetical protein